MPSDPDERGAEARELLLGAGADGLGRGPWQHPKEPPTNEALVRFALWHGAGRGGPARTPELEAGLALLDAARSDLDTLEAALVLTARAEGLTWARIAEAMGLGSPQAAQQRYQRTAERPRPTAPERAVGGHE